MSRVFANGSKDRGSIPGRVIPKTQKMVLYAALLNIQHCKVRIKGKVKQSREWSSSPLHLAIEKGANIRGAYDKFPDFFRMGTFIDSTHM